MTSGSSGRRQYRQALFLTSALFAASISGCSGAHNDIVVDSLPSVATASASASAAPLAPSKVAFAIPRGDKAAHWGEAPWPTEMARLPNGHIDFTGYPGHDSALVREYLDRAAADLDGFSVNPVVFFRFEGPLDLSGVAAEDTTRGPGAAVSLVDVDAKSPERGTFYPLALRATTRDMRYLRKGTLAVAPMSGFVLRPDTLYAAVVQRSFGGAAGLVRSLDLETALAKTPRTDADGERARALHAGAVETLESLGLPRDEIAGIAVFRTGRPHAIASGLVDVIDGMMAPRDEKTPKKASPKKTPSVEEGARRPPRILRVESASAFSLTGHYRAYHGVYCTPNFQSRVDKAPFMESGGGDVTLDASGKPAPSPVPRDAAAASGECPGQLRARFLLTIPDSPAPKDGYPLLVTAHGTGGNFGSFTGERDFAGWAAAEGFAAIATDQPLNGGAESGRPGAKGPLVLPMGIPVSPGEGGPPMAFYNPLYPEAARGNMAQAQADATVLVRLLAGVDLASIRGDDGRPVLRGGKGTLRLDGSRTVLAGHSQGCQSVAAVAAVDPRVRGVILSGCGGDVRIGILRRTNMNLTSWVTLLLGMDPDELSELHPLMALAEGLADPIDPLAFARYYWDPLPGRAPQKVLLFEGLRDSYNPEAASEALAVALHVQPTIPLVRAPAGLALSRGPTSPDRVLAQLAPNAGEDGHFVMYDEPIAGDLVRAFLRRAAPAP
ncbi:MAG: hypothetical protein U0441_13520 [Polyangiaceae bacterium]